MAFSIKIESEAYADIQEAITYYNSQQKGLGKKFHNTIKDAFSVIKKNPFYQIKYKNYRTFYTKPFPFLIHFIVDEDSKTITIFSVLHTSINPNKWP